MALISTPLRQIRPRPDSQIGDPRTTAPVADDVLVDAARNGDIGAFESLYRRHCARVMGLCVRMVHERSAAEDCVQQTFVKAWRNLATFEGRSAFGSWLHSIAVNVSLQHLRGRLAWLEFGATDDDAESGLPSLEGDASQLLDLERALGTLPVGARCVVILHAIYGYKHEEIAAMLGVAIGTCKAQLHRARRLLRARIDAGDAI